MLDKIKRILVSKSAGKSKDNKKMLSADVALCVLLLEAAHADGECSEEEKQRIITTLAEKNHIPSHQIENLVSTSYKERDEAVDIFQFTRYMNTNFSKEEKLEVMESVWRIIHADGYLESHEDHFAHKLANLLRLTHKELIDCKVRARR
jgi:uncharacterized tellurite resistance protein B-like protein